MQFLSASSLLLAAAGLFSAVTAHNIQLPAHGRECFFESLHKDDKMTVSFQVGDREFGSAGNLEIDFYVRPFPPLPFHNYGPLILTQKKHITDCKSHRPVRGV